MMRGWDFGYDNMMNGGWLGDLLLLLFGALVVAGIVVLIVWAVRQSSGHNASSGTTPPTSAAAGDEAVSIAKRRLASGEITRDQYDEIIKALD